MRFGHYLKELIEKRGYSYRKLALLAEIDHTYISKIINGKAEAPSPDILKRLARPLGVTYEELMEAAGYLDEVATENSSTQIKEAIGDDPELLDFWSKVTTRDDLLLMFKQSKDLPPQAIKRIIKYIKIVEDEIQEENQ